MTLKICLFVYSAVYFIAFKFNFVDAYITHSVKDLCAKSDLQKSFNQITGNQHEINLLYGAEAGVIVHQTWDLTTLHELHDCSFTVNSNVFTPTEIYRRGVFVSIKNLRFRQNVHNKNCIDYVRFRFGENKTPRICGNIDEYSDPPPFLSDGEGSVHVHIVLNKTHALKHSFNGGKLELQLIFTPYEKCLDPPTNQIKCKPTPGETDYCIDKQFGNDGNINCPPPHCSDEPSKCSRKPGGKQEIKTSSSGKGGAFSHKLSIFSMTIIAINIINKLPFINNI